ncbi:hypothetical protein ACF06N_16840 [Streptomyces albidoflavus]
MSMPDKVVLRSVEAGAGVRGEAVEVIRGFEEAGVVLYAPLADGGCVLVPEGGGCPLVFQERGDVLAVRTGYDVEITLDPAEEEFGRTLHEVVVALMSGGAVERLGSVYRNRLAPLGYQVEYPGGSMEELGETGGPGEGKRRFSVRPPRWEPYGRYVVTRPTS